MVLGTADANGLPWVSPVYYAPERYREFFWVSSPDATHSRNIASRPEVSIVVFDSRVPIGEGQGVYMPAIAEQVSGADLERGIDIYSRRSQEQGAPRWALEDVQPPTPYRLYRAIASEHSVLQPGNRPNHRTRVTLGGAEGAPGPTDVG